MLFYINISRIWEAGISKDMTFHFDTVSSSYILL